MSGAALWTAIEAAAATGAELISAHGSIIDVQNWAFKGLTLDTRTLSPGDLFVAVAAARDGHDFLAQAKEAGAAGALVSHVPDDAPTDFPLLLVEDVMAGLRSLGAAARDRHFGKLIAVTGSAGKTSTKEMLRVALKPSGTVHAAVKSFNNHLGVPLTLAALPSSSQYGVFEIGMNHAGEISPLVALVHPHIAIITTVAAAHLENFDSMDGIAAAKAEILTGVRPGGAAILPADNMYYDYLVEQAEENAIERVIPFGKNADPKEGARLDGFELTDESMSVSATVFGVPVSFTLGVKGEHHAQNAMAVLAGAVLAGSRLADAVAGLETFVAGGGRGATHVRSINGRSVRILDESYNANPASMVAAMNVLGATSTGSAPGRRLAVLGEMKELGPDAPQLHADLAKPLAQNKVDGVFTAGPMMKKLAEALPNGVHLGHAEQAIELQDMLLDQLKDGDIILFKGSNASKVGALLNAVLAKADRAE